MKSVVRIERHPSRRIGGIYEASGLVGGLTAALLLRDVHGDRVALLGKPFVRGHCLGRNRSEWRVFRNRRGWRACFGCGIQPEARMPARLGARLSLNLPL
jgi:hypothetical protein